MEYEAYQAGTLSQILVDEGQVVAIGAAIALFDDGTRERRVLPPGVFARPCRVTRFSCRRRFPAVSEADNSKRPSREAALPLVLGGPVANGVAAWRETPG